MEVGEKFEAVIEKVVFGGDAMCKAPDGIVVFVANALPQEKMILKITQVKKNFARAKIFKMITPSPLRQEPQCPFSHLCTNCKYLATSFENENQLKHQQLVDIVKNSFPEALDKIEPMVFADEFFYRNKVTYHAHRVGKLLDLGYVKSDNVTVVDIDKCLLATNEINEEYAKIRENSSIMHSFNDGMQITLRYESVKNKTHFWRNSADSRASWLRENFSFGEFSVPLGSFCQVNLKVADALAQKVISIVQKSGIETFFDLYCGSGFFSTAIASSCTNINKIIGIESDAQAIECAKFNLKNYSEQIDCQFVAGDTAKKLPNLLNLLNEKSMLLVDPPRNGLDIKTLNAVGKSANLQKIIYISCNPSSWVRDIIRLKKYGYKLVEVQGFNMFSRTGHFELFSYLEK